MKFKCKLTGCVYEFTTEHDIKTMKEHPDYAEVVEQEAFKPAAKKATKTVVTESDTEDSI